MFEQINLHPNLIKYELIVLKVSLNQISQDSAKKLIKTALDKKVNVCKINVDTVGPATSYQTL